MPIGNAMSVDFARWVVVAIALVATSPTLAWAARGGQLRLEVIDHETKEPLACRIHLTNAAKRPLKAPKAPFWHDHFVFSGSVTLKLPEGEYAFEIERGPEYRVRLGHFTMQNFSDDTKVVDLNRFVDMAAEGWWSGDLDVERPAKDLPLLMEAEDLHVVELVSWPDRQSLLPKSGAPTDPLVEFGAHRYYHLAAGRDVRPGGTLLFYNLPRKGDGSLFQAQPKKTPVPFSGAFSGEYPPQLELIIAAKQETAAWVDAQHAYSWDLPLWVASGKLDSVQLAGSNLGRKSAVTSEGSGRPRDQRLYPGTSGNGRWTEAIYYHLLNCGLRIPPTAGSGSGSVANPLGYNRMYVHVEGELTYEKWWDALRAGRAIVTNGPLIRPNVEGEMPGHVFQAQSGQEVELEIGLTLSTRDRISYLEIIKDGRLVEQVRLNDWEKTGGKLPLLKFSESGWFLIRAVTDLTETYRFATTAPYYVEIGDRPRISKASAQFFLDWVDERMQKLKLVEFENPEQRKAVLNLQESARAYWERLAAEANAR
jgi:hypothetical protein